MRLALLATLVALPALGQFESLATIYDGSRVYFVTNLRQAGTEQPPWGKLFVADDAGIRPLAIRNREGYQDVPLPGGYQTNPYHLAGVAVAHNASRLALLGIPNCTWGSPCAYNEQAHTDVYDRHGASGPSLLGRAILSPNGRWVLVSKVGIAVPKEVVDLDSNVSTPVTLPFTSNNRAWRSHAIADDGTVVLAEPYTGGGIGAIFLIRPGRDPDRIDSQGDSAAIDAAATTIVWAEYADRSVATRRLRILDTRTLSARPFVERGDSYAPAISDDGRRILFLSTASAEGKPEAFVVASDGSGLRQITSEASGVQTAAFSGDGMVAWVLTGDGSLVKISVATGERRQFIGPSVRVDLARQEDPFWTPNVTPGGVIRIPGQRLDGEAQARIGGLAAPVVSADASGLTVQIPWETPADSTYEVGVAVPGRQDPAWTIAVPVRVLPELPQFVTSQGGALAAAHQDFASLVTSASPAVPGEVIHVYATGLGAVNPPVATGQPAPASPLSYLAGSVQCELLFYRGDTVPVDVLYAGLAPGTVGYYQLDMRLPSALPPPFPPGPTDQPTLQCYTPAFGSRGIRASGQLPVKP